MNRFKNDLSQLSDKTIKERHDRAILVYEHDNSLSEREKSLAEQFGSSQSYFGTDIYSDWPEYVDALEEIMKDRGIPFNPIKKHLFIVGGYTEKFDCICLIKGAKHTLVKVPDLHIFTEDEKKKLINTSSNRLSDYMSHELKPFIIRILDKKYFIVHIGHKDTSTDELDKLREEAVILLAPTPLR